MINQTILKSCCNQGFDEHDLFGAYKIFFGTLVSESRLKIINLLRKQPLSVTEIIKQTNGEQTSISHDLKRLKNCGFVTSNIKGKYRIYSLNKKTIKPLMDIIDIHMKGNCIHILKEKQSKGGKK